MKNYKYSKNIYFRDICTALECLHTPRGSAYKHLQLHTSAPRPRPRPPPATHPSPTPQRLALHRILAPRCGRRSSAISTISTVEARRQKYKARRWSLIVEVCVLIDLPDAASRVTRVQLSPVCCSRNARRNSCSSRKLVYLLSSLSYVLYFNAVYGRRDTTLVLP